MADLKQLRNRIKSVKSTQKITKAMQLVSAAKLKRVKEKAEDFNKFSTILSDIMHDIERNSDFMDLNLFDSKFFDEGLKTLPYLYVVFTSERGLCGAFNSSVIKKVKNDIEMLKSEGNKVKLILVGKKGIEALRSHYDDIIVGTYFVQNDNFENIALYIRDKIIKMIEMEECGATFLYYNKFNNAISSIITKQQMLPIAQSEQKKDYLQSYEYEGSKIVNQVINLYIGGFMKYALLQSKASEEGARMTAMDNATRNAGELINKVTLRLNRSRQALITTELIEIISAVDAL